MSFLADLEERAVDATGDTAKAYDVASKAVTKADTARAAARRNLAQSKSEAAREKWRQAEQEAAEVCRQKRSRKRTAKEQLKAAQETARESPAIQCLKECRMLLRTDPRHAEWIERIGGELTGGPRDRDTIILARNVCFALDLLEGLRGYQDFDPDTAPDNEGHILEIQADEGRSVVISLNIPAALFAKMTAAGFDDELSDLPIPENSLLRFLGPQIGGAVLAIVMSAACRCRVYIDKDQTEKKAKAAEYPLL